MLALLLEQLEDEGEVLLAVAARLRDAVQLRRHRAQWDGGANAEGHAARQLQILEKCRMFLKNHASILAANKTLNFVTFLVVKNQMTAIFTRQYNSHVLI